MVRRTPTGTTTFSEFLELIQEDQKADLLDGVIHLSSPENTEHNDILVWLTAVLKLYIEERTLGRLTVNKVAYCWGDNEYGALGDGTQVNRNTPTKVRNQQ